VCFFLLGAAFLAPVFFVCLLLPVAGASSLTAGRFALTVAVKTPLSIAPSSSLGVWKISARAPSRRRVKAVHLYRTFHGM
jgi:hypothetical protein